MVLVQGIKVPKLNDGMVDTVIIDEERKEVIVAEFFKGIFEQPDGLFE